MRAAFSYKRFIILSLGFLFLSTAFMLGFKPTPAMANPKYASIVMDADTGMILRSRYANKTLHPASLTKVMTLLMAFEAMERGDIDRNSRIRISQRAASMVPSKLGLEPGSTILMEDAIYALVTKSANDIAVAMAEHLAGSEYNFAKKMTRRARQLGMSRTTFRNASGLHHKYQISTARDMAIMARYIINHYPEYYRYFSTKEFTYNGKTYKNHNKLLSSYDGMDGMKTGYVNASGFNLIASAVRNNRRIIAVVFGGKTSRSRNAHMAQLLDVGFERVNKVYIAKANVPTPERKPSTAIAFATPENTIADQFAAIESAAGNPAMAAANITALQNRLDNPAGSDEKFEELAGQGDIDPEFSSRIQTSLAAMNAHRGKDNDHLMHRASYTPEQKPDAPIPAMRPANRPLTGISASAAATGIDKWAIQIGAYSTRVKTGQAIRKAQAILPPAYSRAAPELSPYKIGGRYIFRARLKGYTKAEAEKACTYFKDCMTISP